MPGKAKAVSSGKALAKRVCKLADELGLEAHKEFRVGRRLWGAGRRIDVVLKQPASGKTLGIECKAQESGGTVEEKIPATVQDITAWPIPGLVVFEGQGFTDNMKSFLVSTGKAIEFSELEPWLRLFFGLPLDNKK